MNASIRQEAHLYKIKYNAELLSLIKSVNKYCLGVEKNICAVLGDYCTKPMK